MDAIKSILSPLGMNTGAIQDTLKLVVIGGTVETARRASVSAWNGFVDSFFLTAHFSQEDYPYDWLMHWLSKQPAWGRSREFEITTRSTGRNGLTQSTTGDIDEDEEDEDDALVHGRRKRKVAFMPSIDTTHTIYYRGHWLRITRTKRYPDYGHGSSLKISVVARNNDILKKLVLEAKREYEKDAEHRVHIFLADTSYPCWRWNGARQKRPMSSIVLQPGVKDMLLADCKDFLCSEEWYAERGIPFRRGYLLHGVPGSGKTSLIHSLAGELGLDIYVVSLSSKGMSDNTLTTLMGHVPSRCILLLEDLDAAFTRSVSRDSNSTGAPTSTTTTAGTSDTNTTNNDGSTLSLSGLLNSLDGVAAAEGRLLFATTNHIERLDPALSRPGRMDVWVNFTHATKWQAEGIFKCFFPFKPSSVNSSTPPVAVAAASDSDSSQKNLPGSKRKSTHQIPLLSEEEISELAKKFAESIPEDEMSVAALQGYLLKNKTRPRECVEEVAEWVIQERETREKLKKEKAEREAKEKKEAEEKAQKEKEEKEAKEKEEKETKEKLERKEARAKAKKALRAEVVVKSEPTASTESTATTTDSPSDSSSSSESENTTGVDADTEESVTSEEEDASTENEKKEKWVAVKGQTPAETTEAAVEPTTSA
ncbi:P-loop containing nucleoside triphosphate hydrolase protein [Armillaria novae-zelandiae]|uniref:P-loop containing nucleoside triphosphate hydrolase protein n=1 Tax=Armillaria novae-zelandiae TaxID=153914 RepID=A0AA39PST8_9AGAR|nr:P-loop containing nucleoside triphosphate hydrolase protein [Armillaria novae-zelandiae]